jgi:hypothetical protein
MGEKGKGPVFEITAVDSGLSFQGPSPTSAWNEYLAYSRNKHGIERFL